MFSSGVELFPVRNHAPQAATGESKFDHMKRISAREMRSENK
jgi:hypothetical protein